MLGVLAMGLVLCPVGPAGLAAAQPPQARLAPPAEHGGPLATPTDEPTPARISFVDGQVSFWRLGAQDWAPAQLNVPLTPGDVLFAAPGGTVEVQISAGAFVRAAGGTQLGLDNDGGSDADLRQVWQFRVASGRVGLDLRQLPPGMLVELDSPDAAFIVAHPGYYHADVAEGSTSLRVYNGGMATVVRQGTPLGRERTMVGPDQQVIVSGGVDARVVVGPVPVLSAWDRWGFDRTDRLLRPASTEYVPAAVYGTEALDQYGTWRTVDTYGSVWVPAGMPVGWVPYSSGRWIWDPRFGWTWLDDAPWGWAPYHYGRWVFVGNDWAWTPGPIVARPVYAPALVVFLGGVDVSVGRPVYWAPLSWGEPVIPWWGRRGVVGVPRWAGWGGPRIVNNVVIDRSATVTVTNINVYRNVTVTNAVLGVAPERFGRGRVDVVRPDPAEIRHLHPVRGAPEVQPVPVSLLPANGRAVKPPAEVPARPVVATRLPRDPAPALRPHRLDVSPEVPRVAPRLVTVPPPASPGASGVTSRGPQEHQVIRPVGPGPGKVTGGPPLGLGPSAGGGRGSGPHEVARPMGPAPGKPTAGPPPSPAFLGKGGPPTREAAKSENRPEARRGRAPGETGPPQS